MECYNRESYIYRIEVKNENGSLTGTIGIPRIQGGVETHCEELFPRIVDERQEIITSADLIIYLLDII